MEISEEVMIAMINAARDITVAKINAKGREFDGYTKHVNWFKQSFQEVAVAWDEVTKRVK